MCLEECGYKIRGEVYVCGGWVWLRVMYTHVERSIRKWVLWISFYNIKFKSIYLPSY